MFSIKVFLIGLTCAFPIYFEAQATLKGTVSYLNSGSRPAIGVDISAFGANTRQTNDVGMFELVFPDKKPGDKVNIFIGRKDREGNSLELVNDKVIAQLRIPSRPDDDIAEIIVCRAGQRTEAALRYNDILVKTANGTYEKTLKEINKKLDAIKRDSASMASLRVEKEKLRIERDSIIVKSEEQALFIASINLDRASALVKEALQKIDHEDNVNQALVILDTEKLLNAYQDAVSKMDAAKKETEQVIEGFELRIRLLFSTFDYKEINKCCSELERICKNENYINYNGLYCFSWAVNYHRTENQWNKYFQHEAVAVAFDPPSIDIELGDSVVLKPIITRGVIDSFIWSPTELLLNPDSFTPTAITYSSQTYTLTVYDANGNSSSAFITVTVDPNRNVYIPNAFIPGDSRGLSHFAPQVGRGVEKVNYMRIYDNFGFLIYERNNFLPDNNNLSEGWDGKIRGEYVNQGIFVYIIEVKFLDGKVLQYRGSVTVVR